jgi:hemerythrin superfamily protein
MYEELFETLRKDHQDVRESFRRLKAEDDSSERVKLLFELETKLLPHMIAEERTLYPALRSKDEEIRDDVLEAAAEHNAVRLVLRDLAETPANDEVFAAKVKVLEEMVEHHVDEEESDIFEDIRNSMGSREAGELLQQFRYEKANNPCEPVGKGW